MSKLLLNKKRFNNRYVFKIIFYLIILFIVFIFFFKFYNSNYTYYFKKLINEYSVKYNFNFTELEVSGVNIFISKDLESNLQENKKLNPSR